jgi:hypothetical protein
MIRTVIATCLGVLLAIAVLIGFGPSCAGTRLTLSIFRRPRQFSLTLRSAWYSGATGAIARLIAGTLTG